MSKVVDCVRGAEGARFLEFCGGRRGYDDGSSDGGSDLNHIAAYAAGALGENCITGLDCARAIKEGVHGSATSGGHGGELRVGEMGGCKNEVIVWLLDVREYFANEPWRRERL